MPKYLQFGLVRPKPTFLGCFDDEIVAARTFDRACVERLGHIDFTQSKTIVNIQNIILRGAKKHQSTISHVVKSKKQMQDEWRRSRLEASNKAQSEMAKKKLRKKIVSVVERLLKTNDIDHRLITLHLQMIHLKARVSMMLLWFERLGMSIQFLI